MPFVQTGEMLKKAQQGSYAVGAFNAENMEMVQAIIAAAETESAPVIIQTTPGTLKYAGPKCFASLTGRLAKDAAVPVALHLDHGNSYELAEECAREGYTSLMIDGSKMPFDGNAELTRRVVEMAKGLPVEAELGTVGGKEDGMEAKPQYTDPDEAAEFVRMTGRSARLTASIRENRNWTWTGFPRCRPKWISRWCSTEPPACRKTRSGNASGAGSVKSIMQRTCGLPLRMASKKPSRHSRMPSTPRNTWRKAGRLCRPGFRN